jgi:DDE superfamily endonuclease
MATFRVMTGTHSLTALRSFRDAVYGCFDQRRDALFDLVAAIVTAGAIPSLVHLSLEAAHRRRWGSLYAALSQGTIAVEALRTALAQHPLAEGQPIYAVDVSVWPRCDAETSPERGFYYPPSRHSNGKPVVAGWAYQWLAQLSFARDSWTAPLDVQRVPPSRDAHTVAVEQVKAAVRHSPASGPAVPLFVCDAGYDPVQLARGLQEPRAAILVRLRSGRCFYADADPAAYAGNGRPRRHGAKFVGQDPATWPAPNREHTGDDPQ